MTHHLELSDAELDRVLYSRAHWKWIRIARPNDQFVQSAAYREYRKELRDRLNTLTTALPRMGPVG